VTDQLTEVEARILYTALHSSWIPVIGSEAFRSAVRKLGVIGKGFCCRDCTNIAHHSHRLGGFVCDDHRGPVEPLRQYPIPTQEKAQ
jgi:hypothetical protein